MVPTGTCRHDVGAVMSGALAAAAGAPVLGDERAALAESGERRVGGVGDHEHVTAAPAVAAVGAAVGDVLLATEADCASPARSRRDLDVDLVDEGRAASGRALSRSLRPAPRRRLLDHLADREDRHRADVGASAVVAGVVVGNRAGAQREERVIAADADVLAREDLGAALTDQDGAREDDLAGVALHAEPLGLAVASVAGAPAAFLMRHRLDPSWLWVSCGFGAAGFSAAGFSASASSAAGASARSRPASSHARARRPRRRPRRASSLRGDGLGCCLDQPRPWPRLRRALARLRRAAFGLAVGLAASDLVDAQLGQLAPIPEGAPVALLGLVGEDADLATAPVRDHRRGDRCLDRRALGDVGLGAVTDEQDRTRA